MIKTAQIHRVTRIRGIQNSIQCLLGDDVNKIEDVLKFLND